MMSRLEVFLLLLVPIVRESFSTSCETCKGDECLAKKVPISICSNIKSHSFENSDRRRETGCLNLVYLKDKEVTVLKQCLISRDFHEFCKNIAKVIPVINCRVDVPSNRRVKRYYLDSKSLRSRNEHVQSTVNILDLLSTEKGLYDLSSDSTTAVINNHYEPPTESIATSNINNLNMDMESTTMLSSSLQFSESVENDLTYSDIDSETGSAISSTGENHEEVTTEIGTISFPDTDNTSVNNESSITIVPSKETQEDNVATTLNFITFDSEIPSEVTSHNLSSVFLSSTNPYIPDQSTLTDSYYTLNEEISFSEEETTDAASQTKIEITEATILTPVPTKGLNSSTKIGYSLALFLGIAVVLILLII